MKRKILLKLLAIFTLLSLLCSCAPADGNTNDDQTKEKVIAYLSDASDGFISATTSIENKLPDWLDFKYYDDVDKEATVVYNGVTYTGTYQRTYIPYLDTQFLDRYTAHHLSFCLTRDTKELYSISGATLYENEPKTEGKVYSEAECIEFANDIAKQYINVPEYETDVYFYESHYSIQYTKFYNGIKTSEFFRVEISPYTGKEVGFDRRSLGCFSNEEISKNKNSLELLIKDSKAVADKKANEIYKEVCDKKGYAQKSITAGKENVLFRLENGDFSLITKYNVELDGHSEALTIVTMVEDSFPTEKIPAE